MNQHFGLILLRHVKADIGTVPVRPFSTMFKKAPDNVQWTHATWRIDEMLATKKDSAPGIDGLPYSVYRSSGGIGVQLVFNTCKQLLVGGRLPPIFAPNRTVFIPKSIAIDDQGRHVRCPLTFCNSYCRIFTTAPCSGFQQYSITCIHLLNDTPLPAFTLLNDTTRPGKRQITSLRSKRQPLLNVLACHGILASL